MKIEAYTITILIGVLSSSVLAAIIVWIANKGKTKAETQNIIADTYGKMMDDLRDQIKYQGDQIQHQAAQITSMQSRELEYLKIIGGHQETERELRKQINALENKLSLRITKIEQENQ